MNIDMRSEQRNTKKPIPPPPNPPSTGGAPDASQFQIPRPPIPPYPLSLSEDQFPI